MTLAHTHFRTTGPNKVGIQTRNSSHKHTQLLLAIQEWNGYRLRIKLCNKSATFMIWIRKAMRTKSANLDEWTSEVRFHLTFGESWFPGKCPVKYSRVIHASVLSRPPDSGPLTLVSPLVLQSCIRTDTPDSYRQVAPTDGSTTHLGCLIKHPLIIRESKVNISNKRIK